MWTLLVDCWILQRACVTSDIMNQLRFPTSGLLLEVGSGKNSFSPVSAGLVFFRTIVSEALYSSHQVIIGFPNWSKVMLNQMRFSQNPLYKEGGTEIGQVPVRGMNENTQTPD